jgi:NAD(P)-dependent dehydrogenase (short-subunit alcohol dehydrogenase family)
MQIFDGKAAIVTGGASGLGAAAATALAAAGMRVVVFDLNVEAGEAQAAALGGRFARVDVADPDSVAAGLDAAEAAFGTPRVVVNCAGIAPAAKTVSRGSAHDPELFETVIRVNLMGSFTCASQAAARMVAAEPLGPDGARGVIVNTASVAAYEGQVGQVAYAASKGGIVGMTLPMARDLADKGVRVCAIAPGLFLTPLLEGLPQEVQDSLGRAGALSGAARAAGGVRRARPAHRGEPDAERRGDPARRRDPDGAPLGARGGADQVGALLGDHDDGRIGVAGGDRGMTEASMTRSRSTPRTRISASSTAAGSVPMRAVPTGWKMVVAMARAPSSTSASVSCPGPGRNSSGRYFASGACAMMCRVSRMARMATGGRARPRGSSGRSRGRGGGRGW